MPGEGILFGGQSTLSAIQDSQVDGPSSCKLSGQGVNSLHLAFETRAIRAVCENDADARASYGADLAIKLQTRLADLRAALTIEDLPYGTPIVITDESTSMLRVECSADLILNAMPNHIANPKTDAGHTDWSRVTRIRIIAIQEMM